jgi:hypothetical protein
MLMLSEQLASAGGKLITFEASAGDRLTTFKADLPMFYQQDKQVLLLQ